MTRTKVPKQVVNLVRARARFRCEYCQASERQSGQRCQIDHIIPRVQGGKNEPDNLCLACAACNSLKLDRVDAVDPESGARVRLFNPRTQNWHEHFAWSDYGRLVRGLTACGRATVSALELNRPLAVTARTDWAVAGRHPSED